MVVAGRFSCCIFSVSMAAASMSTVSSVANRINNGKNNAETGPQHSKQQQQQQWDLYQQTNFREIKHLLDSVGLQNACHAVRSDLVDFPRCEEQVESRGRIWRKLEQEEEYHYYDKEEEEEKSEWHFSLADCFLAALCVVFSSIAAGLTVGLLSLDPLVLMIKARAGDSKEASQAKVLLPLIQQRHLLLVTLLLLNTASSETLPVVLHGMAPEIFVVIISVALILFFGEILPSAVFIGSNQMAIAGSLAVFVQVLMWLVYPIAYPISKILDCVVPNDGYASTNYNRNELAALIRLQYEARLAERNMKELTKNSSPTTTTMAGSVLDMDMAATALMHRTKSLDLDEVKMAEGALALRSRLAADLVIGHRKVFSISFDADLNEEMIVHIFSSGYSRVPVYRGNDPKQICGILMTRQLILVKATDNKKVSDLPLHSPRCIGPDMDLLELVNLFQTGGGSIGRARQTAGHMAIVCSRPEIANEALQAYDDDRPIPKEAGLLGIITMEDVLEALLQEQIYDEMDAAGRINSQHTSSSQCSVSTVSTNKHSVRKKPSSREDTTSYYEAMV